MPLQTFYQHPQNLIMCSTCEISPGLSEVCCLYQRQKWQSPRSCSDFGCMKFTECFMTVWLMMMTGKHDHDKSINVKLTLYKVVWIWAENCQEDCLSMSTKSHYISNYYYYHDYQYCFPCKSWIFTYLMNLTCGKYFMTSKLLHYTKVA